MERKSNVKIGIYLSAILMMGVIGISSSLSTIAERFPEYSQTMIQNLISIPCLVVIPVTLIAGKLMDIVAKKTLIVIGICLFLISGVLPGFLDNFIAILVFRGIFGIAIGLLQVLCSALVAEHYEGTEREQVQGNVNSAQMLGCAAMVFIGGWLGSKSWNAVFYVHLIAIISLIGAISFIPYKKPIRELETVNQSKAKITITASCWGYVLLMFVFFICAHIYSNSVSFLVTELKIGTAAEAGMSLAFFSLGGFVMGIIFGKIAGITKKATLGIGFISLAISYFIMAFSTNMLMIYFGSFVCGLALSICMPCMIVGAANSVDSLSAGMAIAIITCSQNFGQFLSPYIVNPIAETLGKRIGMNNNQMAIILGGTLIAILGIVIFIWGLFQNRKSELGQL